MSIAVADMRQAGHKGFHRLGNAPAAPNPSGAAKSLWNRLFRPCEGLALADEGI